MAALSDQMRQRSRALRSNQTETEKRLWYFLKDRRCGGWRFRRQHPIPPYVADFACLEAKLIVEADGGQHAESRSDAVRDRFLKEAGWRVMRFWNTDILRQMPDVLDTILRDLGPHPNPPPRKARGREQET